MMQLTVKSRSYRRFYQSRKIPLETLRELVAITRFCPSARNRQPLRYLIVSDEDECKDVFPSLMWALDLPGWEGPGEGERPAAYIILIAKKGSVPKPSFDTGIAAQTILLAAAEKELGGCMIGSIRHEELTRELSIPEDYEIMLVIALGYPAEKIVIEPLSPGGDQRYWRDENDVHHVPKRLTNDVIVKFTKKNNAEMGSLRFELKTSAMSRRRHNQLDHGPSLMS